MSTRARPAARSRTLPDEHVVPPSQRSRGPFLLFLAGALLAATIAVMQLFHISPAALRTIAGLNGPTKAAALAVAKPGAPVLHDLNTLRSQYGDPKDATYGRLRIPAINVDAPIGQQTVPKDGQLGDPEGPGDVVWYNFGANKGLGGVPGAGGNAVFAGHVDRNGYVAYAGVNYLGPGVFFSLDQVAVGDVIEIAANGKTLRYAVVWTKQVPADTDWNLLFSSQVLGDSITVVTCGGDFNYDTHEYTSRLVVRAVRG